MPKSLFWIFLTVTFLINILGCGNPNVEDINSVEQTSNKSETPDMAVTQKMDDEKSNEIDRAKKREKVRAKTSNLKENFSNSIFILKQGKIRKRDGNKQLNKEELSNFELISKTYKNLKKKMSLPDDVGVFIENSAEGKYVIFGTKAKHIPGHAMHGSYISAKVLVDDEGNFGLIEIGR